ncbi:MAG TPA: adenosine-specific kinase [Candidatus Bathyarchaeia archaeon]|nr:adenosine-specific kinase [Candidatus Bathyarchaeia archaeon]
MNFKIIKINNPDKLNFIIGQSHFIKTTEDLYEALITSLPGAKFGLAFAEASGSCLIRTAGTDKSLEKIAADNLLKITAGHSFIIFLKDCFPINVLAAVKKVDEVVTIFCASANPVEVVVYQTKQGRAILGVVDGQNPKGIEKAKDKKERHAFLRKIGYKL